MKRMLSLALAVTLCSFLVACVNGGVVLEPDISLPVKSSTTVPKTATPTSEPLPTPDLLREAREQFDNDELELAFETCTKCLESRPSDIDAHLLLAEIILEQDGREAAISRLEDSIITFGGVHAASALSLLTRWWNLKILQAEGSENTLNREDAETLSFIAYLLSSTDCFITPREIGNKNDILLPMDIYYNFAFYKPPSNFLYPYDGIVEDEYEETIYLDAEKANQFILDFWGIEIPNYLDDYNPSSGYITCKDGIYYIDSEGYMAYKYVLSSYKALGNGGFLLIFDGDGSNLPPEANEPISEISILIVRRTNTPLGFIVVSKLKERRLDDISQLLEMPDGLVRLDDN